MIVLIAAAALATAAPTDAQRQLADLQFMYDQSCGSRAYATFDDICSTLKKQMKIAERDAKKAGRKPVAVAGPPRVAPSPSAPLATTTAFAN